MAAVLTNVLGRKVLHINMPIRAFSRALSVMGPRFGFDRFQQTGARWYFQEQKAGTWEIGAPTSHVRDLTGRDLEDFTTIARRYATRPDTRRTPWNLVKSLWDMSRIGVIPPPRLDHYVELQQHPPAHQPQPLRRIHGLADPTRHDPCSLTSVKRPPHPAASPSCQPVRDAGGVGWHKGPTLSDRGRNGMRQRLSPPASRTCERPSFRLPSVRQGSGLLNAQVDGV